MQIALGLVIALIIATVILLAFLRSAIRREERAGFLASEPRGLRAAIARRVLGLYVSKPATTGKQAAGRPGQLIADGKKACRS